jgi:hypothetical protein
VRERQAFLLRDAWSRCLSLESRLLVAGLSLKRAMKSAMRTFEGVKRASGCVFKQAGGQDWLIIAGPG